MKFEQSLNHEALKVSQGTLVSPRRDVLHGLLVEIVPRLPPILNAILRLDRYNLGSQAINPIEELPPVRAAPRPVVSAPSRTCRPMAVFRRREFVRAVHDGLDTVPRRVCIRETYPVAAPYPARTSPA